MSYSSVPASSLYYAPESTWERGVEKGGRFFSDYFPHIQASTAAFYTQGPAHVKLKAGAKAGLDAVIFQFLVKKMSQFQRWIQEKSPWLAEQTNKHPLLSGLLGAGTTYAVADIGSTKGVKALSHLFTRVFGNQEDQWIKAGLDAMGRNSIGKKVLQVGSAVNRFMNKRWVKLGLASALMALFVGAFVKAVKDRVRFKREYKQARKQHARHDVDPLTLRAAILMHQRFAQQENRLTTPAKTRRLSIQPTDNPFAVALAPDMEWLQSIATSPQTAQSTTTSHTMPATVSVA